MTNTIVVIGLGPVGLTLAIQAGLNHPQVKIIGIDNQSSVVSKINDGVSPFETSDNDFNSNLKQLVREKRFSATEDISSVAHGDIILLAVGPVVEENTINDLNFKSLLTSMKKFRSQDSLVIINSTLPLQTISKATIPILENSSFVYAYERITPGPNMLSSAIDLPKVISATDDKSFERAKLFFNTKKITRLSFEEAEMAKLLENSYRAMTISFIHEWTLIAEKTGVNLYSVIDAIRERKGTHDNIRSPGAGLGGPCLLKDTMMSVLSAQDFEMPFLNQAIITSKAMHDHVASFSSCPDSVGIIGASYREGINDLRNSPSMILKEKLVSSRVKVFAYDPLSDEYQTQIEFSSVSEVFIFHSLTSDILNNILSTPNKLKIIDVANQISDSTAEKLFQVGHTIHGIGKGHWKTLGYSL